MASLHASTTRDLARQVSEGMPPVDWDLVVSRLAETAAGFAAFKEPRIRAEPFITVNPVRDVIAEVIYRLAVGRVRHPAQAFLWRISGNPRLIVRAEQWLAKKGRAIVKYEPTKAEQYLLELMRHHLD